VVDSLQGDLLCGANRAWLVRVRVGIGLVFWGVIGLYVLAAIQDRTLRDGATYVWIPRAVIIVGLWIATEREAKHPESLRGLRLALRIFAAAWLYRLLANETIREFGVLMRREAGVFYDAAAALESISIVLFLYYLRGLAERIPDADLMRMLKHAGRGYFIIAVIPPTFMVFMQLAPFFYSIYFFMISRYLLLLQILALVLFVRAVSPMRLELRRISRS
jgi:hypothetical protein